jgi:hypothetical protein
MPPRPWRGARTVQGSSASRTARKAWREAPSSFSSRCLISIVCLMLMTPLPPLNILVISMMVAGFGTLVEAASWRGFDNLFLPLGLLIFLSVHAGNSLPELLSFAGLFVASILVFKRVAPMIGLTGMPRMSMSPRSFCCSHSRRCRTRSSPSSSSPPTPGAGAPRPATRVFPTSTSSRRSRSSVSAGSRSAPRPGLNAVSFYGVTAIGMVMGLSALPCRPGRWHPHRGPSRSSRSSWSCFMPWPSPSTPRARHGTARCGGLCSPAWVSRRLHPPSWSARVLDRPGRPVDRAVAGHAIVGLSICLGNVAMTGQKLETDGARLTLYLDGPDWNGEPCGDPGRNSPAATADAGKGVVAAALDIIRSHGIDRVIGPMDGDTWHSYRFVTDSDGSAGLHAGATRPPRMPPGADRDGLCPDRQLFLGAHRPAAGRTYRAGAHGRVHSRGVGRHGTGGAVRHRSTPCRPRRSRAMPFTSRFRATRSSPCTCRSSRC